MEEICKTLKSMVMAYKEGLAVENVNRDYKTMFEEYIPFRKFGYANILEFLKDVPTIRLVSRNGTYYAYAVVDAKTKHIADLIAKQKTPRSKPTSSRRPTNTYSGNYNRSASANRYSYNQRSNNSFRSGRSQSLHRPTNDSNRNWKSNSRPESTIRPLSAVQTFGSSNGNQRKPERPEGDRFYMPISQNGFQQSQSSSTSSMRPERQETDRVFPARTNNGFQQNPSSSSTSPPINHRGNTLTNISMGKNSQAQNFSSPVTRQNSSSHIPPLIPPSDRKSPVSPNANSPNNSFKQKPLTLSPNYSSNTTNGSSFNDSALLRPQVMKPLSERLKNPLAFSITTPVVEPKQTEQTPVADKRVTFAPTVDVKSNISSTVTQLPLTPPTTPPKSYVDPREELTDLAFKLNLPPPEYSSKEGGKYNSKSVYSQIKIGTMKFSSYPIDAKTQNDAEIIVAKQAVADLKVRYESEIQLPTTRDKQVIKQRVIDIIVNENHTSGIFKHKLPLYYQEKYKETLPNNWDDVIIECSNHLTCEKVHGDGIILLPYDPAIDNVEPTMPELILPQEELWPVYITSLISTEEVYGIVLQDNYIERRDSMTEKVEMFYNQVQPKPSSVKEKKHYAVKKDDTWHRVYVDFIDTESETADVFFIDSGDVETIDLNKLCTLDKSFYELAPQAVRFSMAGYEELSSYDMINNIGVELLTNLSCYVQVLSREKNELGVLINGIFYDTSTDNDINVNDLIIEKLIKAVSSPNLTSEGEVFEVYLSHVDEDTGSIFIQICNDSSEILNTLIEKLTAEINEETRKRAAVPWSLITSSDVVYLMRLEEGQWIRVKVTERPQGDQLKVSLIDIGQTMTINSSKLIKIQMIPGPRDNNLKLVASLVEKYPVQTCGIQLHNTRTSVLNDKRILMPLREMAPPNIKLFCKVIKEAKETSLAVVELFKRNETDNKKSLISINNTLALQLIKSEDEDKNNNVKPKSRALERKNSRSNLSQKGLEILGQPKIPGVGEYFDVHVTQTVTGPNHFVVQPYRGTDALTALEINLQSYCEENVNFVKNEDFVNVESLCAAKVGNKWHRAMVAGTFDKRTIVYLCDSGIMCKLDNSELKPLADEFLTIPYQGIKAKLDGHEKFDWEARHDNKFKELVIGRDFVSIIRKIEPDATTPTKQIISLDLVDTSGKEDKNILAELKKLTI